jgi:hypothetical protein
MVGLSMALTIVICVGASAAIYARLVPYVSDLVPVQGRAPTRAPARNPDAAQVAPTSTTAPEPTIITLAPTPAPAPEQEPTATVEAFQPTHQIRAVGSVNFRSGPSRNDPVIIALSPATPLQFLNERAATDNPNDQPGWMKFRIEDGTEGWVRELDTEPYRE